MRYILAVLLVLLLVGCSQEVPLDEQPEFVTLCNSNNLHHLNDVVESYVRHTGSLEATAMWLSKQWCVTQVHTRGEEKMDIVFTFDEQEIRVRINFVVTQPA